MKKLLLLVIGCLFVTGASAESEIFQASLIPEIALHEKSVHIQGVTLSIWGENPQSALSLGIVNGSTGYSSGVSLGLLANYAQSYEGIQLAWVANYSALHFRGLQGGAFNYAGSLNGLQFGLINVAATTAKGIQLGLVNIIQDTPGWFERFPNEVAPVMPLVNWRF